MEKSKYARLKSSALLRIIFIVYSFELSYVKISNSFQTFKFCLYFSFFLQIKTNNLWNLKVCWFVYFLSLPQLITRELFVSGSQHLKEKLKDVHLISSYKASSWCIPFFSCNNGDSTQTTSFMTEQVQKLLCLPGDGVTPFGTAFHKWEGHHWEGLFFCCHFPHLPCRGHMEKGLRWQMQGSIWFMQKNWLKSSKLALQ